MITTTGSRTTTNPAEGEEVKYQLDTETLSTETQTVLFLLLLLFRIYADTRKRAKTSDHELERWRKLQLHIPSCFLSLVSRCKTLLPIALVHRNRRRQEVS